MAREISESQAGPSHEEIARRAYAIFEQRGRPEGRDLEHWLEAEVELRSTWEQKTETPEMQEPRGRTHARPRAIQRF